jgi:hypothetical protein
VDREILRTQSKGGSTNQTKKQLKTILKSNIFVYINKQSTKQKLPTSIENIDNKENPPVKQTTNQTPCISPYVACQLGARNPKHRNGPK